MNKKLYILSATILLLCACNSSDEPRQEDITGNPVMFSAGDNTMSRAIPYLGETGRFVCRMYYISSADPGITDFDDTPITAWLKVNNAFGNSVYRNNLFNTDEGNAELFDKNNFEKMATMFYWQNRKDHAFFAYTDLNRTFDPNYKWGDTRNDLRFDDPDPYILTETTAEETKNYSGKVFDLTTTGKASIAQQPDPAQALTIMYPAGATPEANRVDLVFRHCFSQVQVNIKVGASSGITESLKAENITKIELLGVAEEAYTYYDLDTKARTYHVPTYKQVDLSKYTEEQLSNNAFGTAIQMFDMGEENYAPGYLKSFNIIAFGHLRAIRIYWYEPDEAKIEHVVTYVIQDNNLINLKSSTRYIHNLELRRGTLAVIRPEILPWEIGDTYNNVPGTIEGGEDD